MGIYDVWNLVVLVGIEFMVGFVIGVINYESSEYGFWIEILIRG